MAAFGDVGGVGFERELLNPSNRLAMLINRFYTVPQARKGSGGLKVTLCEHSATECAYRLHLFIETEFSLEKRRQIIEFYLSVLEVRRASQGFGELRNKGIHLQRTRARTWGLLPRKMCRHF